MPITLPNYAGDYFILAASQSGNTILTKIFVTDPGASFYLFPPTGAPGINPIALSTMANGIHDSGHTNGTGLPTIFYGSLFFVNRLQSIGLTYYNAAWPYTQTKFYTPSCDIRNIPNCTIISSKMTLLRMSLPWGGWLDDSGAFSSYFSLANTDPHSDGESVDIENPYFSQLQQPPGMFLATKLSLSVLSNNCQVTVPVWDGGLFLGMSLFNSPVWHIGGCY